MFDARWPYGATEAGGRPIDVLCVGHALVDRLALASLEDVAAARIDAGGMTLVDGARAGEIEGAFPRWRQVAGGCSANTAAGVASFGGVAAFAGAVGEDAPGSWYASDLEQAGVRCSVATVGSGGPTGVCHVLISEGGERSMATSLGAAGELELATIEEAGLAHAKVLYVEGYLLDPPIASVSVGRALELAHEDSTLVSLSLSDPLVVDRHADRLRQLVFGGTVDLLFGNEEEALMLTGAAGRGELATRLRRQDSVAIVTLGAEGAMAITPDDVVVVEAEDVPRVEDTTGAGDLFAAGCLFGLTHGLGPEASLRLGSLAAGEVISHLGARPEKSLREASSSSSRSRPT